MILTYFKTAFRNLLRHKKHAAINIAGLAVALAACIIVFLVIQFEYNTDRHLKGFGNIYQIVTKDKEGDEDRFTPGVAFPMIKQLRANFPQYEFAEMMQDNGVQFSVKNNSNTSTDKYLENTGVFYAEPAMLQMFEVKFLTGSAAALQEPGNAVVSKSVAEKYFGNWKDAVGRRIVNDAARQEFQVAGVFEDVPANSDFPFRIVSSYEAFIKGEHNGYSVNDWGSNMSSHQVYARLPQGSNLTYMDQQLQEFEKKYNSSNRHSGRVHFLQPLANIHFDERFGNNGDHVSSKTSLYTLGLIGLLIILMACINFVNLSTALAVTRSKEVGIRKVMGSSKGQLALQVFIETGSVVIVAALLAIGLAWLALPYVKNIMVVQTTLQLINGGSLLFIVLITLFTILLSGLYPALIMARFRPVEAIKNKINTSKLGSISLRRVLVVLQFAFSQIFIIATIIVIAQMNFVRNADLGFNKEAVLMLSMNSDSASIARQQAFKDALAARSDVQSVSYCFDAPSSDNSWQSNFAFDKMEDQNFSVQFKMGDAAYANTFNLQLLAGRFYDAGDTATGYVVNETLLKKVGVTQPQDAIGKLLRLGSSMPKPVIGVVKDFKQQSMREAVQPILLMPRKQYYQAAAIKLTTTNLAKSNEGIKQLWDKFYPELVYNGSFLDEQIQRFYEQEERLSTMYKVYAMLAIFISCLGLYGLVSFMVVQKTKEVGIRKVLGASVTNLVLLFSKEFTILISIAFLLAAPAAWYLMHHWLENFAFKIQIGAGVFAIAILLSVVIAWCTVGYKAFRAAIANPVKSLRSE